MTHSRNAQNHRDLSSPDFGINSSRTREEVYRMLSEIPAGKVSTYGDIARVLGYPKSARIIGRILHDNPTPVAVPCHRVVHSNGKIGGYAYGNAKKRKLLEKEGIKFRDDDLEEFQKYRYRWPIVN